MFVRLKDKSIPYRVPKGFKKPQGKLFIELSLEMIMEHGFASFPRFYMPVEGDEITGSSGTRAVLVVQPWP